MEPRPESYDEELLELEKRSGASGKKRVIEREAVKSIEAMVQTIELGRND